MANEVQFPFAMFYDTDGTPLNDGYIYIGEPGLNPLSNPKTAYWDAALTIPAGVPRTRNGFISYNGAPRRLFLSGDCSLLIKSKNGRTLYSATTMFESVDENTLVTTSRGTLVRSARNPDSYSMNSIIESGFYAWINVITTFHPSICSPSDEFALIVVSSPDGSGLVVQYLYDLTLDLAFVRSSSDGGTTWMEWKYQTIERVLTTDTTLVAGGKYRAANAIEITLPVSLTAGERIEIFGEKQVVIAQPDAESAIDYRGWLFTTKGTSGYVRAKPYTHMLLTYQGSGLTLVIPPVKIADPATLPGITGINAAWSPDGRYLAVSSSGTPYITIYDWATGVPTKIADPATLPPDYTAGVAWSPDGRYLAVAHTTTPFITIYDWATGSPVKITNPGTLPAGGAHGVCWSPDGRYLAVAHTTTPFITIYDWITGAPVKITNPTTLPPTSGTGAAWSPDGKYLSISHDITPFVTIYDWITGAPVKIANPATLPTGVGRGVTWSPDGQFLIVAHDFSPFATIYRLINGSLIKQSNPATLPANDGQGVAWSPDGRYLAVAHTLSPYVTIYDARTAAAHTYLLEELDTRFDNEKPFMFK